MISVELRANPPIDRERSWIVTNEVNNFRWPGPDVRVLDDGTPFYGAIPDWLFLRVRASVGIWAGRGMRVVGCGADGVSESVEF